MRLTHIACVHSHFPKRNVLFYESQFSVYDFILFLGFPKMSLTFYYLQIFTLLTAIKINVDFLSIPL